MKTMIIWSPTLDEKLFASCVVFCRLIRIIPRLIAPWPSSPTWRKHNHFPSQQIMLIRDSKANNIMVVSDDANLLRCYKGTITYRLQLREIELLLLGDVYAVFGDVYMVVGDVYMVLGDVHAVQISRLCQQGGSGEVARHL